MASKFNALGTIFLGLTAPLRRFDHLIQIMRLLSFLTILTVFISSLAGCARPHRDGPDVDGEPRGSEFALVIDAAGSLFGTLVGQDVYLIPRFQQRIGVVDIIRGLKPDNYPCSFGNPESFFACDFSQRYLDQSCTTPHIPVGTLAGLRGNAIIWVSKTERILQIKSSAHKVQPYYLWENDSCTKMEFGEDSYMKEAFSDVTDELQAIAVPLPLKYQYK